jgi:hypothetical protein
MSIHSCELGNDEPVGGRVDTPTLASDILRGIARINEFVFGDQANTRQVYYATAEAPRPEDRLPTFKIGGIICARKSTLLRWIEEREASSVALDCDSNTTE